MWPRHFVRVFGSFVPPAVEVLPAFDLSSVRRERYAGGSAESRVPGVRRRRALDNRSEDLSTELIDRAIVAFNRGDRAAADALSQEALKIEPDNPEAKDLVQVPAFTASAHRSTVVYPIFTASWASPASEVSSSERMRHDLEIHAHFEAYQKLEESARDHWGWPHFDRQRGARWIEFTSDDTASEDIFQALGFADEFLSRTIHKLGDQTAWMYGCTFTVSIGISRGVVFYGPGRNVLERIRVPHISELAVAGYDATGYVVNEAAELAEQADINSHAISDVATRHLNYLNRIDDELS
jgi:hypothetical protein